MYSIVLKDSLKISEKLFWKELVAISIQNFSTSWIKMEYMIILVITIQMLQILN